MRAAIKLAFALCLSVDGWVLLVLLALSVGLAGAATGAFVGVAALSFVAASTLDLWASRSESVATMPAGKIASSSPFK